MAHLHALCSVVLIFGYLSKILTCSAITTKSVEPDGTICPDIEECFEHRLEQIEKRIERRYESTINGLKREVELLKNSEMHNKIGRKRQVSNFNGTQVAFSARLSASTPKLQHGQDIVFNNVLLNLGNGYHNQHGAFIAPVSGVYSFSVSLLSVSPHCHAELVRDGQILAMIDFSDTTTYIQASQGVIVELDAGDDVSVKEAHYTDCVYYGSYYSTFSGFLLYQYDSPDPDIVLGK